LNLIKGKKSIEEEQTDVDNRLVAIRQRKLVIPQRMSSRDLMNDPEFNHLEDEERVLSQRLKGIQEEGQRFVHKISAIIRPFEFLMGLLLLATTLVIIASIFLTTVDKIASSLCGSQCGYIINNRDLFNPVNYVFMKLSSIFPLDYIFMVSLILYFFLSTMTGLVHIGIRFLWVTLFRIKKGSTAPQGLLVSAILLTLSLLALNYTMTTTVAPQYAHFGSQVYCNQTVNGVRDCTLNKQSIVPCDIYGPTDICTPTVSSTMIDSIIINTPFFGILFYASQWAFLAVFLIGFVVAVFQKPRNNVDVDPQECVDEEEIRPVIRAPRLGYQTIGS